MDQAGVQERGVAGVLRGDGVGLEVLVVALAPDGVEAVGVQARQEVLQFESITRGRFEKSEPTIIEGQDLDVPTYLRKNVRVK